MSGRHIPWRIVRRRIEQQNPTERVPRPESVERVHEEEAKQKKWRDENPPPWGIQVFLNPPYSNEDGWLKGSVTYEEWGRGFPRVKLQVADCTRMINLDFDPDTNKGLYGPEARIKKLETLRDAVNEFCDNAVIHLTNFQGRMEKEKNDNEEKVEEQ